jgi:hypothetical protein
MGKEMTIFIESVKVPPVRVDFGDLAPLGNDIETGGLRRPITIWADGTLVSGARRLRAHFLIANSPGKSGFRKIPAVVVDNIEEAAKQLLADNTDDHLAVPLKPSEICRLWDVLRKLDEPAALRRLDSSRRQGVHLRRKTQTGERQPGRTKARGNGDDYVMSVLSQPFGMSEATASRLRAIHRLASASAVSDDRRESAVKSLRSIDAGESSIWGNYSALVGKRTPPALRPQSAPPPSSAPAARQRATWERALPQMEGLVAGLVELGPPHSDQAWEQVGPTHARLMKIRRDLEKIIKAMKETAQS